MTRPWDSPRILLLLIVSGYLTAGVCYAVFTPAWQAPDEPAHYNYVRYIVDQARLPVLQAGDYPHEYLEEIKSRRFPAEMSIDPLRYEFHQPPLYYLLASVVYRLTGGALIALRLWSVSLGAVLLGVTWALVRAVLPGQPGLALGSTAFVAFLPMHLATASAVNNDVLVELLLAASMLGLTRYLRSSDAGWMPTVWLGLLIGLALVTKISAVIAPPLALVGILIAPRDGRSLPEWRERILDGMMVFGLAGVVVLPWLVRNHLVYGGFDVWGLRRHAQIVIGQPRTAQWLAQMGWSELLRAFATTTFQSFWGQFGWMGIVLDRRFYLLFTLASALAIWGLALLAARSLWYGERDAGRENPMFSRYQLSRWCLPGLLVLWLGLTAVSYMWYNVQFVQHQGRYLFPALIPMGLAFAMGFSEVLGRRRAWLAFGFCLAGLAALVVQGMFLGEMDTWAVAFVAAAAMAFLVRGFVPPRWDAWVNSLPYAGLFALDFVCLFGFIVPGLS